MSLDRLQTIEANLVSTLAIVRAMMADHQGTEPVVAEDVVDPALEAEGPPQNFRTIYEAIFEAVLVEGPLTLNEVVASTKTFSWVQINRHARLLEDSLVNRGVLVFTESPKPGRLEIAPGFPIDGDPNPPLATYLEEIRDADKGRSTHNQIRVFAEFHRLYTQRVLWWEHHGAPMRSGYVLKSVKSRGVLGTVEHLLMREDDERLQKCIAAGRPDASLEWMVAHNSELFGLELDLRAEERLAARGINT